VAAQDCAVSAPRSLWLIVLAIVALALPAGAAAQTATTTTLTASPNPTTAGTPVTLTATASVSGTLTFVVDGVTVGTGTASATSAATPGTWVYVGCQSCVGSARHIAFDAAGNQYLTMSGNSNTTRRIAPNGTVTLLAGGVAAYGIAVSSTGIIYESDGGSTV